MKKNKKDTSFRFEIVEENDKDIVIKVTEEDYQSQLKNGIPEDELLPVGLHKARRGGFLKRHPNFSSDNVEINVTERKQNEISPDEYDRDKKAA